MLIKDLIHLFYRHTTSGLGIGFVYLDSNDVKKK